VLDRSTAAATAASAPVPDETGAAARMTAQAMPSQGDRADDGRPDRAAQDHEQPPAARAESDRRRGVCSAAIMQPAGGPRDRDELGERAFGVRGRVDEQEHPVGRIVKAEAQEPTATTIGRGSAGWS